MNTSADNQKKWRVEGVVGAPVEQVTEALLAVRPGPAGVEGNALVLAGDHTREAGAVTLEGGPEKFTGRFGTSGEDYLELTVDRAGATVGIQTWFGGTYTVEPADGAGRIVLTVHNVVPGAGRIGRKVAEIGIGGRLEKVLTSVLEAVSAQVGAPTPAPAAVR
ncbi:hypothetical protein GTW43_19220 [Streptomyces sp. SID5785]|uniref:hypothetical protein n=1 Tax=Streptomyces sp. SID5785 TaxID=2690309 RepID=UPI001361C00D|nr:hypothetical protein [Streptomyces sp. SID5785]MZD07200.1 hypothetical protein [Streptomyces sp. SID5785]